ncbi:cupin domain protein [Pleurostoma richardsiae]|uniref:Cupin domain protein n=1 Tax=Pleurostoma richardsiae TaxID=41990 RepID=A0AA38VJC4_9PEZI|nr:cupin domain protein [Pleurostoma richardsiae]
MAVLRRVQEPPINGGSYIVDRMDGEIFTLPGSKGAFRMYCSQVQTGNTMSVFGWDGPVSDQSYHYHKKTHDIFLNAEGLMKIYCDGQSRILGPGDFASVPPGLIHKPTPLGPITKALPLITPADWVEAFRVTSDPYKGVMFPEYDNQWSWGAMKRLGENWEDKYDSYPTPVENPPEPNSWSKEDTILPDEPVGYFLKANSGPRWVLGGISSRPFITTKQSFGKCAISSIESSKLYKKSAFSREMRFATVHHLLVLFEGRIDVAINNGPKVTVYAGEVVFLEADTTFTIEFLTKYVKFWSYASGDGLESIIQKAGVRNDSQALPDAPFAVDDVKLDEALAEISQ